MSFRIQSGPSWMAIDGLMAAINTPDALKGDGLHSLPPHWPTQVYAVDEYPACPDVWEHGSDKASSYFVSLEAGRGMWFDFTPNSSHNHQVAVVISVQGLNPVTGKPITELCLVQHKKQCPEHKIDFQQDRYCPTCEHKWEAQNYIATTTGLQLWLDGFRNENGEVRQYIISEEQARGIAKQVEDRDPKFKRVWAIGFAFYLSKDPKPAPPPSPVRCETYIQAAGDFELSYDGTHTTTQSPESLHGYTCSGKMKTPLSTNSMNTTSTSSKSPLSCSVPLRRVRGVRTRGTGQVPVEKVVETKKLEIGAGARIQQEIGVDPNPIEFWQPQPAGMIYVNFVGPQALVQIIEAGKRQDKQEGPLNGLKVGN